MPTANKILEDKDGVMLNCFAVKPSALTTGRVNIPAGVNRVSVEAVTNDANDWVILPSLAKVPLGHKITILCSAGGNFELRTPASSNEKINDVDSDGSQEYLCTDTDTVELTKISTTQWIGQSITKLGAVRTAVVPD